MKETVGNSDMYNKQRRVNRLRDIEIFFNEHVRFETDAFFHLRSIE